MLPLGAAMAASVVALPGLCYGRGSMAELSSFLVAVVLGLVQVAPGGVQGSSDDFGRRCREIEGRIQARDHARAAALAEQLVTEHPEHALSWIMLASCHLEDGWDLRRDARAEEAADQAYQRGGDQPQIQFLRAVAKYRQRRPEALELISHCIAKHAGALRREHLADLYYYRADAASRGERQDAAVAEQVRSDLEKALTLDRNHASAMILKASQARADGRIEEAERDALAALKLQPGSRQVHYELVSIYRVKGEREELAHHLEIFQLIHRLTDSTARISAPTEAERLEIHRRLKEINPEDVGRRLELIGLELSQGSRERAQEEYDQLHARYPEWKALEPWAKLLEQREGSGG